MVMYEANDVGNLFTDNHWVPTVHIDNTPGLAIKAYIAEPALTRRRRSGTRRPSAPGPRRRP